MSAVDPISQRDLRLRSKEIMDTVEAGGSFVVTRDGRPIAELTPVRAQRRFVPRADFVFTSRSAPELDPARLREDLDRAYDDELVDRYAR